MPLAAQLRPLTAAPGQVLMQQGEHAVSFLLIGSGRAEVTHTGVDGHDTVAELQPGTDRRRDRAAAGRAAHRDGGRERTADGLGRRPRSVRRPCSRCRAWWTSWCARRASASPRSSRRSRCECATAPSCICGRCCPATTSAPRTGPSSSPARRCTAASRPRGPRPHALMNYLFEVDYVHHFVWVMTDGPDGPVVADARFVRDEDRPDGRRGGVHRRRRLPGPRHRHVSDGRARGRGDVAMASNASRRGC